MLPKIKGFERERERTQREKTDDLPFGHGGWVAERDVILSIPLLLAYSPSQN